MEKMITILLPSTLYVKKMKAHQGLVTMHEEYNIYFKNIIQPYNEMWDVRVNCKYGENLGHCWRLSNFLEDISEFDLEIAIYDEYGEKIASRKTTVIPVERKENLKTKVLFFGDSMTHRQSYINHVVSSMRGIDTVGTRCFDGHVRHEGRGGWSYASYYKTWAAKFGLSPFLFPKGIAAKDYYGDKAFLEKAISEDAETYQFYGYDYEELKDGQYYVGEDQKLYIKKADADELVSDAPEFEFDFAKYLERFDIEKPEIVSVLLGANDLQTVPYERSDAKVAEYIENTKFFIEQIHRCDKNIKVIVNLPILGAEQYAWGTRLGCGGSSKMYRHNIMKASGELIKSFDGRQDENIFISPMLACIDPENGFPFNYVKVNKYNEAMEKHQSNWVHPNESGYCQIGDALAGVIEFIRGEEK